MNHRLPSGNAVLKYCLRIILAVSALMPLSSDAQEPDQATRDVRQDAVRRYPDPGYRLMGVYAGGPDAYFDYSLAKMSLGDTFPNKSQWWTALKKNGPAHKHNIYTVYVGVREGKDFETCRRRLDAWLKPEADAPTYPELLPAICLEEENIGSRTEVLDRLGRHIRDNYGVPVFQWYTDPLGPNPALTADGWIWDSYGWSPQRFRRHVMRFVATGKPAICVPWASDPHWPQWTQYPSTEELINREWHQFRTCLEFNVSTAPFCVAGPGAMNPWLSSDTPDMRLLRGALRSKRREMRALRPGELPLVTANSSAAARAIPVGGDAERPSRYVESYSGFAWIDDATITGFLDLMLTSRPAEPGFLVVRPRPREAKPSRPSKVDASLTYHLRSYFPLKQVRVQIEATAPSALGARTEIALTRDELGRDWPVAKELIDSDDVKPLVIEAGPDDLQGTHDVYVRVRARQATGDPQSLSHFLDNLQIECIHEPPPAGAAIKLAADQYGNLSYDDDFSTSRWRHFGEATASAPTHGGYRESGFWVGLKGGYAISTKVLQRVSTPRPMKELTVTANVMANSTDLGGTATLKIGPRGGEPKWAVSTKGRHNGPLTLVVPSDELPEFTELDVIVELHSTSGVEQGAKACATLENLSIRAR